MLINPAWVSPAPFHEFDLISVDPAEPAGANALLITGAVVYPAAYPRTRARLNERKVDVRPADVTEILKAEGGVTCCSLVFTGPPKT